MTRKNGPLRVGIGGPVGAGKTTLTAALCRQMRGNYSVAAITNDIYTREDAEALVRMQALPAELWAWKPAGARTRQSARMRRSIWPPLPI